jgi:CBS domain containing-hemolysin-like protein
VIAAPFIASRNPSLVLLPHSFIGVFRLFREAKQLFSLKPNDFKELRTNDNEVNKLILELRDRPKTLLATILDCQQPGKCCHHYPFNIYFAGIFDAATNPILAFIIAGGCDHSSLILLVGEIIPKVMANKYPQALARFMARALKVLMFMFKPLSLPLGQINCLSRQQACTPIAQLLHQ